jgi:hypothetical protein
MIHLSAHALDISRPISALLIVMMTAVTASSAIAQPTGSRSSQREALGVIRGRITAADDGRPLRRATVSLRPDTSATGRPLQTVTTNTQGVFVLREVAPGSYFVSASRPGYVEIQHGQRRPRERGTAITVTSGETRERIDIALPRGAVISGRVVDELGAPYPGVTLIVLAVTYQSGERSFVPSGSAVTDDLGNYRISGMQPGRYYVMASSSEMWRNEKKETLGYAATFFPGVPMIDTAQAITVGVSEEKTNSDLVMFASRTARVRGRVLRPTGEPLAGEPVMLGRSVTPGAILSTGGLNTRTGPDGAFEFQNVAPAVYMARAGGAGSVGSASLTFPVAGADVENLVLVPRLGSTVIGTIVTDEGGPPPFPASGVRVNLAAPLGANVLPTVRVPAVNNDWTVQMNNVGGAFKFRMVGLPDGWMLDSVKIGERDVTDTAYDVPTGGLEISELQIVLTRKVSTVTGDIVTVDGKPTRDATIVLFAEDASLWGAPSRFVRSTRPTADGTFSITGLPGGTYLAVAREFVTDGEWETKDFLEAARQDGVRVTLTRGGSETVTLKLR